MTNQNQDSKVQGVEKTAMELEGWKQEAGGSLIWVGLGWGVGMALQIALLSSFTLSVLVGN